MSSYKMELGEAQLKRLAELLMGAAYADGDYDGDEAEAIGDALHELMAGAPLPDAVTAHLARFDVAALDVEAACAELPCGEPQARRAILTLITRVLDADRTFGQDEALYLTRVGQALGAQPDEYEDLTLELTIIVPPPIPR